jgi:hypothetical protein
VGFLVVLDLLLVERSADPVPVGGEFSAPVQTGTGTIQRVPAVFPGAWHLASRLKKE